MGPGVVCDGGRIDAGACEAATGSYNCTAGGRLAACGQANGGQEQERSLQGACMRRNGGPWPLVPGRVKTSTAALRHGKPPPVRNTTLQNSTLPPALGLTLLAGQGDRGEAVAGTVRDAQLPFWVVMKVAELPMADAEPTIDAGAVGGDRTGGDDVAADWSARPCR